MIFRKTVHWLALLWLAACHQEPKTDIQFVAEHNGGEHPTELLFANDQVWLAQLKSDSLFQSASFPFKEKPQRLASIEPVKSPHFMAADEAGVYVSEGRGDSVRYFSFDGHSRGEALPIDQPLQRPHGLCIQDDWLYIADSVGSRLLRWHLLEKRSEVFADHEKKIAYARQLLCREDGIWISNSYEGAFALNPGVGSNILRIDDFKSGMTDLVVAFPDTNTTGIAILDDKLLLVGRWVLKRDIVMLDLETGKMAGTLFTSNAELDAPYSITVDEENRRFYVAFLGINPYQTGDGKGAILEWRF